MTTEGKDQGKGMKESELSFIPIYLYKRLGNNRDDKEAKAETTTLAYIKVSILLEGLLKTGEVNKLFGVSPPHYTSDK
jgi:hypothetical protein